MRAVAFALVMIFAPATVAAQPPAAPTAAKPVATTPARPAPAPAEPALSRAQNAAIAKSIAALKTPEERHLAAGWNNAKKVAEVICRPAALPALKKQVPNADRVFLGSDDPTTLTLVSVRSLTGVGQVRSGSTWRDFTFTCALMPSSGKVAGFTAVLKPAT
ncbi:hypothetical protein [Phenylobacterium sp.]|uniref:hypothetical protein n=1 Tax=Phenylobacterium sp. TaxID=1871053 RepID=UPI0028A100D0|nr:hypothetical protein [Phenylobacterium sp.]